MSDVLTELRKRAHNALGTHGPPFSGEQTATSRTYEQAAFLVESDPLYKMAPELAKALRLVKNHVTPFISPEFAGGYCADPAKWIESLLAKLPKEPK